MHGTFLIWYTLDVILEKREKNMIFRFNYHFIAKGEAESLEFPKILVKFAILYVIEPSFSCPMCVKSFYTSLIQRTSVILFTH